MIYPKAEGGGFMETRMKTRKLKRVTAAKSVALFAILALTPIALLFAGQAPKRSIATEMQRIERSQQEWRTMKSDVELIMKKANKLKRYAQAK